MASLLQQTPLRRKYRDNEYLFQFHSGMCEKNVERYFYNILLNGLCEFFHDPDLFTASELRAGNETWKDEKFKMSLKTYNPDLENIRYLSSLSGARGLFYRKKSEKDNKMRSVFVRYNPTINEVRKGEGTPDERRQYMLCSVVNQGEETIIEVTNPCDLEYIRIQRKFAKHFSELPKFLQKIGKSSLEVAKTIPAKNSAHQHEVVQNYLMRHCPYVVACEVPVSGMFCGQIMTTFIDVLARDYRTVGEQPGYYVLDYKPNALREKHVIEQLRCGRELFCQCTNTPHNLVKIGWFDESHIFLLQK